MSKPCLFRFGRTRGRYAAKVEKSGGSESRRMTPPLFSQVKRQQEILAKCPNHSGEEGAIYVLRQRDGGGFVKIGKTVDLVKRVGDHQGGAFGHLDLIAAFHGYTKEEGRLHDEFRRDLVWNIASREMFRQSRMVRRFVDDAGRLNGRDHRLCWSCRRSVMRDRAARPWVGVPLLPFEIKMRHVDQSCGAGCFAVDRWFDLETGTPVRGVATNGYSSDMPDRTASAYFEDIKRGTVSETGWAVSMWMHVTGVEARRWPSSHSQFWHLLERSMFNEDGTDGIAAPDSWRGASLDLHHNASIVMPGYNSFPRRREELKRDDPRHLPNSYAEFVEAMEWFRSEIGSKFGLARFCGCKEAINNMEASRRIMERMWPPHAGNGTS